MRKCKQCGAKKPADKGIQTPVSWFCCSSCAFEYGKSHARAAQERARKKAARLLKEKETEDRARIRARKEVLKTLNQLASEAQTAFNSFIRIRDYGKPCISCGNLPEQKFGGTMDAGHYRSRGAASHLRFNTFNVHSQCVRCNRNKSGNVVDYRINLINRIGLERVERLETDNDTRKFDKEYLRRIKRVFSKKARLYKHFRGLD
jgi:hypothetical protein